MTKIAKIRHFLKLLGSKNDPQAPLRPPMTLKNIFLNSQDMKTPCQKKEFLNYLAQKKASLVISHSHMRRFPKLRSFSPPLGGFFLLGKNYPKLFFYYSQRFQTTKKIVPKWIFESDPIIALPTYIFIDARQQFIVFLSPKYENFLDFLQTIHVIIRSYTSSPLRSFLIRKFVCVA